MTNYIHVKNEDDQLKIMMYLNDEPQTWIMFNEDQTEKLISVLKKELKVLKKKNNKRKCNSKHPDNMCDECDCWKMTRAYCS